MTKNRVWVGVLALCGLLCLGAGALIPEGTLAYFSDHAELVNQFLVGWNDSGIEENFPDPEPAGPGEERRYPKEVSVTNRQGVPCYIRLAVVFSDNGIGDAVTLSDLDTKDWIKADDGYYYYLHPVAAGGKTKPLFTGVVIGKDADYTGGSDKFTIYCYEESIQASKDGVPFADYREAWSESEGGGRQ